MRGWILILPALALGACAGLGASRAPASAAGRGEAVAQARCSACHAIAPGAASSNAAAPPFASREMRHTAGLEGRLAELTAKGHYGMPPVALRPDEVQDLLAYIESLDRP